MQHLSPSLSEINSPLDYFSDINGVVSDQIYYSNVKNGLHLQILEIGRASNRLIDQRQDLRSTRIYRFSRVYNRVSSA